MNKVKLNMTVWHYYRWMMMMMILPPVVHEDGSTANTETLCPRDVNIFPTTSMNEDFPAPGGPDNPEESIKKNQQHWETKSV